MALFDNKDHIVVDEQTHELIDNFEPSNYSKRVIRFQDLEPEQVKHVNEFYRYVT